MLKCVPFRVSPKVHHDVDHCSSGHGDEDLPCTSILLGMSHPLLGIILLFNIRQLQCTPCQSLNPSDRVTDHFPLEFAYLAKPILFFLRFQFGFSSHSIHSSKYAVGTL